MGERGNKMNQKIKDQIIKNGVKNLKEFGYLNVTTKNIVTDEVYKILFESQLNSNLGHGFDEEINSILKDMNI